MSSTNKMDLSKMKVWNNNSWFNPAIVAAALVSLALWASSVQSAQDVPPPRIVVNGQGTASIAPDMAILSLTVTREAETAQGALKAGSSAMADVLVAMKTAGVADKDLQTSGFSIQPRYTFPTPKSGNETNERRIVGYTVRNSLTVKVRDIDDVGMILDKSVSLGVNEGGNINFTNNDASATITQARIQAMKDAANKAQTLAKAAGVNVGKILEISEQSYYPSAAPAKMSRMMASDSYGAEAVPVAAGENTYSVTVNVSYAIDQ